MHSKELSYDPVEALSGDLPAFFNSWVYREGVAEDHLFLLDLVKSLRRLERRVLLEHPVILKEKFPIRSDYKIRVIIIFSIFPSVHLGLLHMLEELLEALRDFFVLS
jgi:hypothetical protein